MGGGQCDLEAGSDWLWIGGKPLAEVEEKELGERRESKGGGGEKLASSPHASLNRPTRLVAKSHQSWGKHMRKKKT